MKICCSRGGCWIRRCIYKRLLELTFWDREQGKIYSYSKKLQDTWSSFFNLFFVKRGCLILSILRKRLFMKWALINQVPHSMFSDYMDTTLWQDSNFRKQYILQLFKGLPTRRHDNNSSTNHYGKQDWYFNPSRDKSASKSLTDDDSSDGKWVDVVN